MRTLRLTLAYDGTNYVGWQRQLNGISIQQLVEDAFAPFAGGAPGPDVAGAGRTDAGVHALGQVASVIFDFDHPVDAVRRALNVRLPPDIRVLRVEDATPGFHARFDAKGKAYRYRLVTASVVLPFERWFVWHVPGRRDLGAMRAAAAALVGPHDFASFQADGTSVADTVRTIDRLDLTESSGSLTIDIAGDGFLRHMVRIIAGTLADVGTGVLEAGDIPKILAARDRRTAGRTAPAQGLTLVEVHY